MPYRTAIALTLTLRDRRISASEKLEDTITRIGAYDERVTHPLLKARYADLAWEMSGLIGRHKHDPEDARIAIGSYLQAVPLMADDHEPR
jgi:hypothetical protein